MIPGTPWRVHDGTRPQPRVIDPGTASTQERPGRSAYVTVVQNGVLIHHHQEIQGPTGYRRVTSYDSPHGPTGPIMLQDHGDLVRFRNIWVRPIEGYDQA
jgi:hypothetical protein